MQSWQSAPVVGGQQPAQAPARPAQQPTAQPTPRRIYGAPEAPKVPDPVKPTETFRTLTAADAAAMGLPAGGTYQVNAAGKVQVIQAPPKVEAPKNAPVNPEVQQERRARIGTSLRNLRDLRKTVSGSNMGTGSIVGQESYRAGEDFLGMSGWFNQTANDVAGKIEMVQGDLINQVRNEMNQSGAPIGARGADTEKEASRLAASIANLAQTQDEAEFLGGVQRAEEYYLRRYIAEGGDPGEFLSEALKDGATLDELDSYGKAMGVTINRDETAAAIRRRERGDAPLDFVRDPNDPNGGGNGGGGGGQSNLTEQVGTTLGNTVLGYAQGAGEAVIDFPLTVGTAPRVAFSSLVDGGRALYADATGNPEEAAAIRAQSERDNERMWNSATPVKNLFNALAPAPEGYETQRDVARFMGGFLVPGPKGAKATPRAPAPTAPARAAPGLIDNAAEVVAEGQRRGVPVMRTDIAPPQSATGRYIKQTLPEKIPFAGTSGPRQAQQEERVRVVGEVLEEFGGNASRELFDNSGSAVEDVSRILTSERAQRLKSLTTAKNSVIDEITAPFGVSAPTATPRAAPVSAAGNDIPPLEYGTGSWIVRDRQTGQAVFETFSESVARKIDQSKFEVLTAKQHLASLNGVAPEVAARPAAAAAPAAPAATSGAAPNTMRAINEQVSRLQEIDPVEFAPVIERLQRFGERITSGVSLRVVEEQRKLLGAMFEDPNLSKIRDAGQKAINAIYDPLRRDMGDFIEAQAGSAARAKWSKANEQLAGMAGELKAARFRNVLRDADTTPEAVGRILFGDKDNVSDMKRLVENLPPAGRKKVQAALLQRAFDNAGGAEGVSVERFLNNLNSLSGKIGVAFEGADRQALEGVRRLLEATRRGAAAGANIRTGEQNLPAIMGIGATQALGAVGGIGTLGVGGLVARLYESPMMRNRLLALSTAKPGSPQESRLLEAISRSAAPIVTQWRESMPKALNDNPAGALAASETEQPE